MLHVAMDGYFIGAIGEHPNIQQWVITIMMTQTAVEAPYKGHLALK